MIASPNEIKCIEISRRLRKNIVQRKIQAAREKHLSIFITPKIFMIQFANNFHATIKVSPVWKTVLLSILLPVFYIIVALTLFFVGLFEFIIGKRKSLASKISEIEMQYYLDDDVSEIKSFSQLWEDKGLDDYRIGQYKSEEQNECIMKWVQILYGRAKDFDMFSKEIKQQQIDGARTFHEENPSGHIKMASVESLLPKEIDKHYGNYFTNLN